MEITKINKTENIKYRIIEFIRNLNISKSKFYSKTGLSNGMLDKASDITCRSLVKIQNAYPILNIEWLLTGNGEMFIDKQESKQEYEILTDQYCIDFLKKTGKYKILKIDYTEL